MAIEGRASGSVAASPTARGSIGVWVSTTKREIGASAPRIALVTAKLTKMAIPVCFIESRERSTGAKRPLAKVVRAATPKKRAGSLMAE
jgi:hypothetical protein